MYVWMYFSLQSEEQCLEGRSETKEAYILQEKSVAAPYPYRHSHALSL